MIKEFETIATPEELHVMFNRPDILIERRIFMYHYLGLVKRLYNEVPHLTLYNRVMVVKTTKAPCDEFVTAIKDGCSYLNQYVENFNIYKESFVLRINSVKYHIAPPIIELGPLGMVLVAGASTFVSTKFPTIIVKTDREPRLPVLDGFISDNNTRGKNPIASVCLSEHKFFQPSNGYFTDPELSIVL